MTRRRWILYASYYAALLLFFQPYLSCSAKSHICEHPSSCGNTHNIRYPFRLKSDPDGCGDPNYELSCENNHTVLHLSNQRFYIQAIDYHSNTIRLIGASLQKGNCSNIPLHPLSYYNFSYRDSAYSPQWDRLMLFLSCKDPVKSPLLVDEAACTNKRYSYVMVGDFWPSDIADSCRVDLVYPSSGLVCNGNCSYLDVQNALAKGFLLSWNSIQCEECKGKGPCRYGNGTEVIGCWGISSCDFQCFIHDKVLYFFKYQLRFFLLIFAIYLIVPCLGARFLCGMTFLAIFITKKWRRRHSSEYDTIEDFLQSHNNLMPIRYTFSEIKKITDGFKEKLGQGGYGSVYKGKLRSGTYVAVKILSQSKASGKEFINEVATIGSICHVNIVQLIGYSVEGSKRALVYEFMTNGSLEKYIFPKEGSISLGYDKIYEISLGVARGIEYLHRGCNMQILHFDIKPHNILLDGNFIPKVSDFGLAKLYPRTNNVASLTAARGTLGYIAPELFYKRIGAVSSKADVYSFGILLMEMAGRRKNFSIHERSSSQFYYPSWVYDQLVEGKDLDLGCSEEESDIAKKMSVVALWCIQLKPDDRPSINKVIEMLELDMSCLRMPPKPSLFFEDLPLEDAEEASWLTSSLFPLAPSSESITVITSTS